MEDEFVFKHVHTDLMLTEEQSTETEMIKEIEFAEEGDTFDKSWIGPEFLPFFAKSCSFNPKVVHKTLLESVREVNLRILGKQALMISMKLMNHRTKLAAV